MARDQRVRRLEVPCLLRARGAGVKDKGPAIRTLLPDPLGIRRFNRHICLPVVIAYRFLRSTELGLVQW